MSIFPSIPRVTFVPGLRIVRPAVDLSITSGVGASTANAARGTRHVVPQDGDLRDLSIFVGTSSGNVDLGIYDAGDASATVRTRLWSSGSTPCGTGAAWQTIDPGPGKVHVVAGQQVELVCACDNGTATFVRWLNPSGFFPGLPPNFLNDAPGAPNVMWQVVTSFPLPGTLAQASMTVNAISSILVLARVEPC